MICRSRRAHLEGGRRRGHARDHPTTNPPPDQAPRPPPRGHGTRPQRAVKAPDGSRGDTLCHGGSRWSPGSTRAGAPPRAACSRRRSRPPPRRRRSSRSRLARAGTAPVLRAGRPPWPPLRRDRHRRRRGLRRRVAPSEQASSPPGKDCAAGGSASCRRWGRGNAAAPRLTGHIATVRRRWFPRPTRYLWALAVAPRTPGEGRGSRLLEGLARSDRSGSSPVLEPFREANVRRYRRHGFEVRRTEPTPE
jgi:GNAT superfamily N-acetyltransferase